MAAAPSPEEQILALRRALAERDVTIAALTTGLAAEQAAHEARRAETVIVKARLTTVLLEIEHMKMQLASLRRQRYGQSSEKLDRDIAQLEMRLEDLEETAGEQIAASPKLPELEPEAGSHAAKPQRKPLGRKPLPEHLPREIVVHEPVIACVCRSCDPARLTKLGESTTEILEKVPATLKVIRHVRPKYACRVCEPVFQAPEPDLPIEKGRPGPGLLAPYRGLEILRRPAALPAGGYPGAPGHRHRPRADGVVGRARRLMANAARRADRQQRHGAAGDLDRRHTDLHPCTGHGRDPAVALLVLHGRSALYQRADYSAAYYRAPRGVDRLGWLV